MRMTLLAAVAAAGFACLAASGASAAPAYGTAPVNAAAGVDLAQDVHYRYYRHRHHHHRHCWWRHGRRICRW